jgi:hypothetical protein
MNSFELMIFDSLGKKCTLYSVRWQDSELNETDKFFLRLQENEKLNKPLTDLALLLEYISDEKGALDDFFRFENQAQALPSNRALSEIEIKTKNFPLRLYCLKLTDSLLILFGGGEKTADTAQEGKTSMAFHEANLFAKRILKALQEEDIYITDDKRELRYFNGDSEIYI